MSIKVSKIIYKPFRFSKKIKTPGSTSGEIIHTVLLSSTTFPTKISNLLSPSFGFGTPNVVINLESSLGYF